MRFARVPESLLAAPVSDRAFRVLVGLLLHADREGWCRPTNGRLAGLTGLERKAVLYAIRELVEAGIVAREGHTTSRQFLIALSPDSGPSTITSTRSDIGTKCMDTRSEIGTKCRDALSPESGTALSPDSAPFSNLPPTPPLLRTEQEQKERDSPLPLIPVPHDPLATQADRLADAEITRRWGEDGVQIYRQAQSLGVGLAWMLPAVEACHTSKGRYVPTYVAGIVRGYRAEGGPPAPPVAGTVKRKPLDPFEAAKEERAAKILAYREANRK
jgi:hypothetical protein